MEAASQVKTRRGREKFAHDGYLYVLDSVSRNDSELMYWRCEQKCRCKARLHTKAGKVLKTFNQHSHEASALDCEIALLQSNIRKRAAETLEPPAVIVSKCTANVSQACLAALPKMSALRKLIGRQRHDVTNIDVPAAPNDLSELVFPDRYKVYNPEPDVEEKFLLCDSGPGSDRILIFGRESWLQHLVTFDVWLMDGTCSIAPSLFQQVLVIMAKGNDEVIPVVYALLADKQRATYIQLFESLKGKDANLTPKLVLCDFEQTLHNALKAVFPEVRLEGCLLHLSQSMHTRLATLDLLSLYNSNADFAVKVKMIIALAFVPLNMIDIIIDILAGELPGEMQELLNWFEDNFIGRKNRTNNFKRPPIFSHEMWNVYEKTITGDKTNMLAEAAHRKLQYELGLHEPTIWKFIDKLKKAQKSRDDLCDALLAGHQPPRKARKYEEANRRILELLKNFQTMDFMQYLSGLAYNLQLKT